MYDNLGRMSADLPALLAQATDDSKSSTERLFAAVALRNQIDKLMLTLDDGSLPKGVSASVVADALTKCEGQSGIYRAESGSFEAMSKVEAERLLKSMAGEKD